MKQNMLTKFMQATSGDEDVRVRKIECGISVTVVCMDTMSDDGKVSSYVLQPLAYINEATGLTDIYTRLMAGATCIKVTSLEKAMEDYSNGHTIVFDDDGNAVSVDTRTSLARAIAEPPTSMVLRGPREGFVEDVKINITLLRKRLKTPDFKYVNISVGKYTNTSVSVCYIDSVADKAVVDDIIQRISAIKTDGIMDSSYIARYLDKNKTLLFRRVGITEKPDIAVAKMLEGRVAIIVDGSPMVLTLPYLFMEDIQSPGDYYENSTMTALSRTLRFISVLASLLLPALYVCLQVYNYQIIPIKFLITLMNASESIPFSPLSEMLLVLIIFDILREANLRMPSAVGISLSLVGAIVLGDAAVKAGLLGAPAVMIGALSGIGLFTLPDNTLVLSLLRLLLTFIGGTMGLLGVTLAMMAVIFYLASLQSNKSPFLAPYAPAVPQDLQDGLMQDPVPSMKKRPRSISNKNKTRRG